METSETQALPDPWFEFLLLCEHRVFTKVKIDQPQGTQHFIKCRQCLRENKGHLTTRGAWIELSAATEVPDDVVRDVLYGFKFVMSRDIMRVDQRPGAGTRFTSGPFPYVPKESD